MWKEYQKMIDNGVVENSAELAEMIKLAFKAGLKDKSYSVFSAGTKENRIRSSGKVAITWKNKNYIAEVVDGGKVISFREMEGNYTDIEISGVTVRVFNTIKWQAEVAERYCNFPNDICNAVIFHPSVAPEPKSGSRGDIARNTLNRLYHGDIPGVRYYIQTSEDIFLTRLSSAMMKNDISILNGLPHTQIQG